MSIYTTPLWLVYEDETGTKHYQPYADVVSVGTLIDPETGYDMPIVGWTDREPGTVPATKEEAARMMIEALRKVGAVPVALYNEEGKVPVEGEGWSTENIVGQMFQTGEDAITFSLRGERATVLFLNTSNAVEAILDWSAVPGSTMDNTIDAEMSRWTQ